MDDHISVPESFQQDPHEGSLVKQHDEPEFGAIDIVDAFTALRHEYRGQIKETRQLSKQLDRSTERIKQLESTLNQLAPLLESSNANADDSVAPFTSAMVEFDIQLTRAVDAAVADDRMRRITQRQFNESLTQSIAGLSRWSRWFAKPVIDVIQRHGADDAGESSPVADGLSILLTKLRQSLSDLKINRIETFGKPFDGQIMRSIGVLEIEGVAAGHVSEQLSPAYVRDNQVIKYADVRVAP